MSMHDYVKMSTLWQNHAKFLRKSSLYRKFDRHVAFNRDTSLMKRYKFQFKFPLDMV